jgi:hypothetical protein
MRDFWESDRPREQMTPEQLTARVEGWKRTDQERAAAKEAAEQRRVETYRESLRGEPPKLGEGGLLDARMRIEDRTAEGDFKKITRGVWYSSEPGWGHIESGEKRKGQPDELAVKAKELIEERTPFEKLSIAGDVEMKLAARMVRDEVPLMTVVINRRVCEGPRSCDTLLEDVLPIGYKLRVYQGDDTMKLYEGKWEGTG